MRHVHGSAVVNIDHLRRLMLDSFVAALILGSLGPLRMEVHDSFQSLITEVVILGASSLLAIGPIRLTRVLPATRIEIRVVHRSDVLRNLLQG
jgi:hypothetical protein